MIGFWNYTVYLTYLSAAFGCLSIIFSGAGEIGASAIFLGLAGIIDMFDGRIARSKKDRSRDQKLFGIQIDSLCDLISFGVAPMMLAFSLAPSEGFSWEKLIPILFLLCGIIRLSFFNVDEMNRQDQTDDKRTKFLGIPITTSSPVVIIYYCLFYNWFNSVSPTLFYSFYLGILGILGILYISKIPFPKFGLKGILLFVVCVVTAIVLYLLKIV